jgi:hypothetical protein
MKNKRILIASPFFPYPPSFGGIFDILGRIKELKKLGYTLDLIYSDKKKPKPKDLEFLSKFINELYFVKRTNKLINLFSFNPLQVVSRKGLRFIDLKHNYDLLIIENDSAAEILSNPSLKAENIVLRVQNNESIYFQNLANSTINVFKKAYYYSESIKFKRHSSLLFNIVNRLWFISSDEYLKDKVINARTKGIHLPSPINLGNINRRSLDSNNVLFVGALFMPNNLEAIEWYLKNIHKDVLKVFPKYKFIIAGSTGKYSKSYFDSKFSNIPAVEVYFDLDSLDFVYDKASVFVNPMRHGAGVKIKSIHSIINGLPLVSTKTGSEGIGLTDGVNFLHGETKTEFINGVMAMLKDKPLREKIALGGQAFLKENNSEKILEDELFTIFK